MAELSPMMQQYQKIKAENQGAILFFRLGDFYEMFFDDAVLASKELELTLTARDCGQNKKGAHVRRSLPQQRKLYRQADFQRLIRWPSVSRWRIPPWRRGW